MDNADYKDTLEFDEFEDTERETLRIYEEHMLHLAVNYARVVGDIINIILCLIVIGFDIFLIYVLCRFKKLKCQTNSYIMHYAIINILYILEAAIVYVLFDLFPFAVDLQLFCVIKQFEGANLLLGFLFAFGLSFDWLIICYKPSIGKKISNVYKFFIWIIYIFSFIFFLVHCLSCSSVFVQVKNMVGVIYVLILIFIICLNILSGRNKDPVDTKVSHSLTIANIIIFSWLPTFTYHTMFIFARSGEIFTYILWFTKIIPEIIAYSNPIVIAFMLGRLNNHFKVAYLIVFKKSVTNYSNVEDNLAETEGDENTATNTHSSHNDDITYT